MVDEPARDGAYPHGYISPFDGKMWDTSSLQWVEPTADALPVEPSTAAERLGPPPRNGAGTASLVLALISFFVCGGGLILPILAIVYGWSGIKRARAGEATNGGVAKAGFTMGIIGLAISVVLGLLLAWTFLNPATPETTMSQSASQGEVGTSWAPSGFTPWDDEVAWRWADESSFACSSNASTCAGIDLVSHHGCRSIYVEMAAVDDGGAVREGGNGASSTVPAGGLATVVVNFPASAPNVQLDMIRCIPM